MVSSDKIERETERDRGILSGPDRKWLLMDRDEYVEEHSRQYWGQRRDKIQNRLRNAMLDFSLLFDHMDHEERPDLRERIFTSTASDDTEIEDGIRDGFAFLLEACGAAGLFREHAHEPAFNRIFEGAWNRLAWLYRYRLNSVEIDVDAERIPWRELRERLEAGEELTIDEQAQLLIAFGDDVDPAETQKVLNRLLLDEGEGEDDEMPTEGGIYDPTKE